MQTQEGGDPQRIAVLERQGAFADRDAWAVGNWCRIERALELVGTRSAMILLREATYGATRFEELVRRTGLSEAVAAGRLKELVAHGLMERRPYQDPGSRKRFEYVLTERGGQLFPVLVSLMEWGELLADDVTTGVELVHRDCGKRVGVVLQCADGHPVDMASTAVQLKDESWVTRLPRT